MHTHYGWFMRRALHWLFRTIHFPAQCTEQLRALGRDGVLVYVSRGRSSWVPLYFNYILNRLGLPLPRFVGGVNFFWLQTVEHLLHVFRERHATVTGPWVDAMRGPPLSRQEALLAAHAVRGEPAFVAMSPPRGAGGGKAADEDYVRALIAAQRVMDRPIYLVSHILVDPSQSGAAHRSLADRIFGDRRRPGGLRHLAMLFLTLRHGTVRMADPLDLKKFLADEPDADDAHLARKIRHELNWRMTEEERVVAGPRLTVYDTTERHVVRDPVVRATIQELKEKTHKSEAALEKQAQASLRTIAARYNVRYIKVMRYMLNWVFNRIYDGIVVDEAGLTRVIEASRKGPLIFCPSHKSHVDYLVLSFILWSRGITPPHIAAGANLSFFPLGLIFRGCGAFFLRRSFRDDPLYAAVFRAYIVELVKTGTSLEFFLEGTRSRTGKLLLPKFGVLSMIVDAWRRESRDDVQFVPVSIDYERIIEASSYEKELKGAEKKTEDIGGLLRTTKVLRSRYGQVQVQFGDPVSLAELAKTKGLPQSIAPETDQAWREEIERLGFRILHKVATVCSVTSTAVVSTALLGHPGRGMAQNVLLERCDSIAEFLEGAAGRMSPMFNNAETRVTAVLEAVQKLVDEGVVAVDRAGRGDMEPIYRVPEETRVILDFHKNAVMNYFAPVALVARTIQKHSTRGPIVYSEIYTDTRFLSRLFKKEFIYRSDSDFGTYFDESLGALAVRGILDVHDDMTIHVRQPATLAHLAGLLDSFVQGYLVTARTLLDLRAFPLWQKEFVTRTLERTRRAFLEGDITRPETANRSLIEAALNWMIEAGVVEMRSEGKRKTLQLSGAFGPDKLQGLIDEIRAYL